MQNPKLWVRAGDADNYNDFDGFQQVADYLPKWAQLLLLDGAINSA